MSKNSKQIEETITIKSSQQSQIETGTIQNSEIVSYNALEFENCKAKEETVTIKKSQIKSVRDNYIQVETGKVS